MKRIYLILGALVAMSSVTYAQQADLTPVIDFTQYQCLNAGQEVYPMDTTINGVQQPVGAFGVVNNGPDAIDSGTTIMTIFPFSTVSSQGAGVFTIPSSRYAPADSLCYALSYFPIDSIHTLLDIDAFNNGDSLFSQLLVPDDQLVDSGTYGFYVYIIGTGTNPQSPDNTDDSMSNNFKYVPVVWHCNGEDGGGGNASIEGMIEAGARHINIFPNPANNVLHFKYGFIRTTKNATARVIDMTGRVLESKNLGSHTFGTEEFTMDVSKLPAGNYMLEISTGYMNAVGKFTVQK